jgi:hypothetical protein
MLISAITVTGSPRNVLHSSHHTAVPSDKSAMQAPHGGNNTLMRAAFAAAQAVRSSNTRLHATMLKALHQTFDIQQMPARHNFQRHTREHHTTTTC